MMFLIFIFFQIKIDSFGSVLKEIKETFGFIIEKIMLERLTKTVCSLTLVIYYCKLKCDLFEILAVLFFLLFLRNKYTETATS
jgi:hypothetical protein